MTAPATPLHPITVTKPASTPTQPASASSPSPSAAARHPTAAHSHSARMDAVTTAAAMGTLPAANGLPDDPIQASTVSRLFPHPPAPDSTSSSTPAPFTATSASDSVPVSPHPTSPPRTPAAPLSMRSAASPSSLLASPASERANPMSHAGVHPAQLVHSLHHHQHHHHHLFASSDALPVQTHSSTTGLRSPVRVRQHGAASPVGTTGTSPPGLSAAHAVPWQHTDLHATSTPHSPSIFERDIEHRDASHIMTKQEAMDVAIPSVLDDAAEAIIEDHAQIEVVTPQNPAPPLALSSAALSVHSSTSPSSFGLASSPSPPLSASGALDTAPPGTMAAQIAEKLAPRATTLDDANTTPRRSVAVAARRPGSDADSAAHSMRSRSPRDLADGGSPVRSHGSASPVAPGLPPVSLVAAVSQTHTTTPLPAPAAASSGMPTATAFPSLPLPNPFRSSSPNLSAMAIPSLTTGADAGRPATSSVSIDGAIISGTEVATLDHSLDTIADVLAAHDAEQAASPYVPRSPAPPAVSGTSSPLVEKSRNVGGSMIRQPQQHPGMGAAANANRAPPPGTLGLTASASGLGVFNTGESLFQALASGSPSPSADKRRLSFFSYADILNENKGEVMDLQGVVRHAAERDEQQHGLFHAQPQSQSQSQSQSQHAYGVDAGTYEPFTSQPSIMQQLGGAGMARSVSTSAAASPRIGSIAAGPRSSGAATSNISTVSGAYTPARGRRDLLENKALTNRLDSLNLASSTTHQPNIRKAA
ncbi:uncharacterized protein UMAG_05719 [Mycosarcoma maydis]|uniref:Uncharacterized protein n=1 Tax=Mycosarcoma maydis TaxID=5270 RepID=A0A0D1BYM1_MYCMD|nr:uncharacterized protein UMAG_05719 [Ustilago maydis 521]KIS66937.1 hypothetical protein UMAG_05719 [Ustilago maydis 521]|eukprot:XP_011391467.1 hypothetical protein UMAG_05719 [Ustilago maydis 521]